MRVRELAAFDYGIANHGQPDGPSTDIHYGESNKDEKLLINIGYTAQ